MWNILLAKLVRQSAEMFNLRASLEDLFGNVIILQAIAIRTISI
jgi:hypothetical protein